MVKKARMLIISTKVCPAIPFYCAGNYTAILPFPGYRGERIRTGPEGQATGYIGYQCQAKGPFYIFMKPPWLQTKGVEADQDLMFNKMCRAITGRQGERPGPEGQP